MIRIQRSLAIAASLAFAAVSYSQTLMDITVGPGLSSDLEVRLRPDADFDGVFAGVVFTLRWSNASGANLGPVQQDSEVLDFIDVNKSGPEQVQGGYRYQIFAGFGFTPLSDIPCMLEEDEEFVLCRLPILNAEDAFIVAADAFTQQHNGDFFISLNGADATGIIYDINTGVTSAADAKPALAVWPSPVVDLATVAIDLPGSSPIDLDLLDARGVLVWSERIRDPAGVTVRPLDMRGMAAGAYVLRSRTSGDVRSLRLVKH